MKIRNLTTDERTCAREYAQGEARASSVADSSVFEQAYRQYALALRGGVAASELETDVDVDCALRLPVSTQLGGGSVASQARLDLFSRLVERYDPSVQSSSAGPVWARMRQERYLFDIMSKPFDAKSSEPYRTTIWYEIMTLLDLMLIGDSTTAIRFGSRRSSMLRQQREYAEKYGTAEKAQIADAACELSLRENEAVIDHKAVRAQLSAAAVQPASAGSASASASASASSYTCPTVHRNYTKARILDDIEATKRDVMRGRHRM
jgi:hypothetical protein